MPKTRTKSEKSWRERPLNRDKRRLLDLKRRIAEQRDGRNDPR